MESISGDGYLSETFKKMNLPVDFQLNSQFQYTSKYEISQFKSVCNELKEDRIRASFIQGAYNPFIRNYPFPFTHLNINYLIDPRSVLVNSEYNKLYDEHADKIVPFNRADPLHIPGVSRLPFNPDEHPVPKDNRPWWQVLVDFYKSD